MESPDFMAEPGKCSRCGTALAPDAPGGHCARCILEFGLDVEPESGSSSEAVAPGGALTELAGDRIGRYKLLQQIGEGGCGLVYMAEQEEPVRRRVALKVIKLGMDTKSVVARFEAERQALALMDHPNIAKVLDAGATESGRPFFVMELVRGVKITDYCDQNSLTTRERLDLFVQVCRAVQHAHQKGIIHRDLKPSNILVTVNDGAPVPRVIDFGIAKATQGRLTDHTLFTAFEQFLGTPAYMSPEQSVMTSVDVDTRSDIYSLGVLLYELLTGKTPFDTKELLRAGLDEMRRAIREQEPLRPSTQLSAMRKGELTTVARRRQTEAPKLVHLVRGDLDWIVMKCLEKDRARRYETANGLAVDVQRHLKNEPVVARPPSNFYRLQKSVARHRVLFFTIVTVAAALIGGLGSSTWMYFQATEAGQRAIASEREQARLRREAEAEGLVSRQNAYASDMYALLHVLNEGNFGLARNLLARHLPRAGQEDLRGFEWRYFWNLSQGEQRLTIRGHANGVTSVAYSSDGAMLASGSADHTIKLWNPETGELIGTMSGHSGKVNSVAFSRDGNLLASGGNDGLVRVWDVHSRRIVFTLTNRSSNVAFSSNLLAITTDNNPFADNGGSVKLWDCAAQREVLDLPGAGNQVALSPDGTTLATANGKSQVQVWDVASGQELRSFPAAGTFTMAFSPDGRSLAWGRTTGEVRLWNLEDEASHALSGGGTNMSVCSLAFSPDGQTLVTADQDYSIRMYDIARREQLAAYHGHGAAVLSVSFAPDGKSFASGGVDDTLRIWDANPRKTLNVVTNVGIASWLWMGHPVFTPDGKTIAAALRSGGIQFWNAATCRATAKLETTGVPVGFSHDGQTLLALDEPSGALQSWDVSRRTLLGSVPLGVQLSQAYSDAISPDQTLIAVGLPNGIALCSTATGKVLFRLSPNMRARCVEFSPDSRWLAAGYLNHTARIWDLATRKPLWPALEFRNTISTIAFLPDGKSFAAGGWDSTIRVCDAATGDQLLVLEGHKGGILRLTISNDRKTLASASSDGYVKLWNLATGRETVTLPRPPRSVRYLGFSRDDETLAIGELNGTLQFYHVPSFADISAQPEALGSVPTSPTPGRIGGTR